MLRNDKGEPLTAEFLLPSPRASSGIVLPYVSEPAEARHQGHAPRRRSARSTSGARRRFDYDIIVDSFAAVDLARQRAARFLGLGRRRPGRQPQHHRHQEPGDRLAHRQARRSPRTAPSSSPPRARSIACCCGTTTSCRSGTIPTSGSPTGTCSAGRRSCRRRPSAFTQVWWFDPDKQQALAAARGTVMHGGSQADASRSRARGDQPPSPTLPLAARCSPAPAAAEPRHGLSIFGDLKYPADFKHFDYVNPDAPKGGRVSQIGSGGAHDLRQLQRLHPQGRRGAGARAALRQPHGARAATSPTPSTGLSPRAPTSPTTACRSRSSSGPRPSSPTARPSRRTTSCSPSTSLKEKGHPQHHDDAARRGEGRGARSADRALHVPRASSCATCRSSSPSCPSSPRPSIRTHDFDQTSLERPLGSGPYKIGDFKPGTFVSYMRRDDYWAKDLPVNRGLYQLRRGALRLLSAIAASSSKNLLVRHLRLPRGVHLQGLGDGLRHAGGQGGPAHAR